MLARLKRTLLFAVVVVRKTSLFVTGHIRKLALKDDNILMKQLIIVLMVIYLPLAISAQDSKTEEKQKQAVINTLEEMWAAIENEDIERYASFIHPDFTAFGENDTYLLAEGKELEILQAFLTEMMDEGEVEELVGSAIKETGASSPADIGKVMGKLSSLKGKVDMGMVSSMVKEKLS